jgi:acyl carrier protein
MSTLTSDDAHALLARLVGRIAPGVDLDELELSAFLDEEAELDSIDFLELLRMLEEETGIDVPEQDYPLVVTTDGFEQYVTSASGEA